MKKVFVVLIVLAFLMSSAALADEARFRDVPWGCDVSMLEKALIGSEKNGFVSSYEDQMVPYVEYFKLSKSKRGFATMQDATCESKEEIGWFTSVYYYEPLKVAGYDVSTVAAYSVYGYQDGVISKEKEDAAFYAAEYSFDVRDKEAAYKDLQEKLKVLYGDNPIMIEDFDTLTSYASDTPVKIQANMYTTIWPVREVYVILNMECNDGPEDDVNASVWYNSLSLAYMNKDYESQIRQVDAAMGGMLDDAEKKNAESDFGGL